VLHSLAVAAARYGRYITPLLSFSIDFYVRLFVRIDTGASKVKELASQVGTVHVCNFCQTPTEQRFGKVVEKEDKQGNVQKTFKPCVSVRAKADGCEYCGGTLHVSPSKEGFVADNSLADRCGSARSKMPRLRSAC
jgi:tRNA (guanine26-N2/guanine27-N2)-dimethyltransferase